MEEWKEGSHAITAGNLIFITLLTLFTLIYYSAGFDPIGTSDADARYWTGIQPPPLIFLTLLFLTLTYDLYLTYFQRIQFIPPNDSMNPLISMTID